MLGQKGVVRQYGVPQRLRDVRALGRCAQAHCEAMPPASQAGAQGPRLCVGRIVSFGSHQT